MIADKSLKISEETKKKLDSTKIHQRETYDDIINRLIRFRDWLAKIKKMNKEDGPIEDLSDCWSEMQDLWKYL